MCIGELYSLLGVSGEVASVAEEAGELGALDGTAAEKGGELFLRHLAASGGSEGEQFGAWTQRFNDGL